MKSVLAVSLFLSAFLIGCGDGVPKVEDYSNVVVDGQKMTQSQFLQKHCVNKSTNDTCNRVKNAMSKDATKGVVPRF